MKESLIGFYFCVAIFDSSNLYFLRQLVYSFLLSNHNHKTARKIHKAQSRRNKLTLSYIKDHTVYPKHFVFWHRFSFIYFFSLIPQYAIVITVNFFLAKLALIFLLFLFAIKLFISIAIALQFDGKISRFDKAFSEKIRKKRKK